MNIDYDLLADAILRKQNSKTDGANVQHGTNVIDSVSKANPVLAGVSCTAPSTATSSSLSSVHIINQWILRMPDLNCYLHLQNPPWLLQLQFHIRCHQFQNPNHLEGLHINLHIVMISHHFCKNYFQVSRGQVLRNYLLQRCQY